jgi:hypothetical protein
MAWVFTVGAVALVHAEFFWNHLVNSADPDLFNDDSQQQIFPFFKYISGVTAFDDDYIANYYLDNFPIGYQAMFWLWTKLGFDPVTLANYLPHILSLITAACLMIIADHFGGKIAAFIAGCLWFGSPAFAHMVGGLPRSFAFPLSALLMLGLMRGRPKFAFASAVLGAAFYPMVGVLSGICLAIWMVLPANWRGMAEKWPVRRRLRFVGVAAGLSILVLSPAVVGSARYNPLIEPFDDIVYPEAGDKGRLTSVDTVPFHPLLTEVQRTSAAFVIAPRNTKPLSHQPRRWLKRELREPFWGAMGLLGGLSLLGWLIFLPRRASAVRLAIVPLAAFSIFSLARFVIPALYLPPRYLKVSVPLVVILVLSSGLFGLLQLRKHTWLQRTIAGVSIAALTLLLVGHEGDPRSGLRVKIDKQRKLLEFLATTEEGALIAGMPFGPIENVPYYSRRPALLTRETHQAFHEPYVLEMRGRAYALISATYATDIEPLRRLAEDHGVTHLLVDRRHFRRKRPPRYFAPFTAAIRDALEADRKCFVVRQLSRQAIFSRGSYFVLDLPAVVADPANQALGCKQ